MRKKVGNNLVGDLGVEKGKGLKKTTKLKKLKS